MDGGKRDSEGFMGPLVNTEESDGVRSSPCVALLGVGSTGSRVSEGSSIATSACAVPTSDTSEGGGIDDNIGSGFLGVSAARWGKVSTRNCRI